MIAAFITANVEYDEQSIFSNNQNLNVLGSSPNRYDVYFQGDDDGWAVE
jgi:hypothetical protein